MWEERVTQELGRRVHFGIGFVVATGGGPRDVTHIVQRLFAEAPLGGSVQSGLWSRCRSLIDRYMALCLPVGWTLVGIEETLPGGRVDLVWREDLTGRILIEELKIGRREPSHLGTRRQVATYYAAGMALWRERFAGVRVTLLRTPHRSWMVAPGPTGMALTPLTAGLEIR